MISVQCRIRISRTSSDIQCWPKVLFQLGSALRLVVPDPDFNRAKCIGLLYTNDRSITGVLCLPSVFSPTNAVPGNQTTYSGAARPSLADSCPSCAKSDQGIAESLSEVEILPTRGRWGARRWRLLCATGSQHNPEEFHYFAIVLSFRGAWGHVARDSVARSGEGCCAPHGHNTIQKNFIILHLYFFSLGVREAMLRGTVWRVKAKSAARYRFTTQSRGISLFSICCRRVLSPSRRTPKCHLTHKTWITDIDNIQCHLHYQTWISDVDYVVTARSTYNVRYRTAGILQETPCVRWTMALRVATVKNVMSATAGDWIDTSTVFQLCTAAK